MRWLLIALLFLSAIAVLNHAFSLQPVATTVRPQPTVSSTRERVTKHLQMTNKRLEISQGLVETQNQFLAPRVGDRLTERPDFRKAQGVPMNPDRSEHNPVSDLKRKPLLNFQEASPSTTGQIRDRNDERDFQHAYREQYVQQFLANARKAGYDVRLNDDLIVVGVRRINPSQQSSSNPVGSGAE